MAEKLPKNMCCVGRVECNKKVFVEEYVVSFLKEVVKKESEPQMIVFYGDGFEKDGCKYFFLKGAAGHKASGEVFGKIDEIFFQTVGKKYFSEWKGIGWYRTRGRNECKDVLQILRNIHEQDFGDINGYYIYFEKNMAMEDYLLQCRKKNDTDVTSVKREKNVLHKKRKISPIIAMQILNMISLCILIICCIIAVTTLNQYDKMKHLERTVNYLEISMEEQKNLPEDSNVLY